MDRGGFCVDDAGNPDISLERVELQHPWRARETGHPGRKESGDWG